MVLAIRCFIARRGKPALFVSDNFESFKSADVKKFILKHRIKWKFILGRSPWWGAFYERLTGIVKSSLKKTLGKAKISYVEMCTIISEVEGDMNNRPLIYLNEENVNELLTPNHMIYGRSLTLVNENNLVEINENEMRTMKVFTTNLLKQFMGKLKHEYLLALQQRH